MGDNLTEKSRKPLCFLAEMPSAKYCTILTLGLINGILENVLSCRQTFLKDEYELDIEFSGLPEEKQQIISNYTKNRP